MDYYRYYIADMMFILEIDDSFYKVSMSDFSFRISDGMKNELSIHVKMLVDSSIKDIKPRTDMLIFDGIKTCDGNKVYMYDKNGCVAHLIDAAYDWRDISVLSSINQLVPFEGSVGEVIFRTSILFNSGIVVHASAIEYEGKGIIFSAPSGTGKSTQADLWVQHKGALILNGDRPALRILEDQVYVYGTPWSGTSNQYLNKKAPLSMIVLLEQSPENEIKRLSSEDAVRLLVARCYLPFFDEGLMELALDNIGEIIKKVPVYLLKCRPDFEAVELVAKCLK